MFQSDQRLGTDIRGWISKEPLKGDRPYTFTQIATPLLNHSVTITEEEERLESIGLMQNAPLVMVHG